MQFFSPPSFNPKLKNILLALHPQNFVCREPWHRANYSCKEFTVCEVCDIQTNTSITDTSYHRYLQYSCSASDSILQKSI